MLGGRMKGLIGLVEAGGGIEPPNSGFAVRCITTLLSGRAAWVVGMRAMAVNHAEGFAGFSRIDSTVTGLLCTGCARLRSARSA
jgi:hypothetical protein